MAKDSLNALFELLAIGDDRNQLSDFPLFNSRVAGIYADLLLAIQSSTPEVSFQWISAMQGLQKSAIVTRDSARQVLAQIKGTDLTIIEPLRVRGTLIGSNVRTRRFEIFDQETGARIVGRIHPDAIVSLENIAYNSDCFAVLQPTIDVNETTGVETTSYELLEIELVSPSTETSNHAE